jgi:hypothetical protein
MRGHGADAAACLLSVSPGGTPVALPHAARERAQPRRRTPAAGNCPGAPQVPTYTRQRGVASTESCNHIVVVCSLADCAMPLADGRAPPAGGGHWCRRAPQARGTVSSAMALRPGSPRTGFLPRASERSLPAIGEDHSLEDPCVTPWIMAAVFFARTMRPRTRMTHCLRLPHTTQGRHT